MTKALLARSAFLGSIIAIIGIGALIIGATMSSTDVRCVYLRNLTKRNVVKFIKKVFYSGIVTMV